MNKFIKLIVVTDGVRFRAFRFSARRQGDDLFFHCAEIPGAACGVLIDGDVDCGSGGGEDIEGLADRIVGLVSHEQPELWNLVAPSDVGDQLGRFLGGDAGERLTKTISDNMINVSLAEVVLRFPPAPCGGVPSAPQRASRHRSAGLAVA